MTAAQKPLIVKRLTASNVMRLKAVDIAPDGSLVVLGGKNGAGKSSCLNAITAALGGKERICREPLRRGAEVGEIVLDLDEYVVRRVFLKDGTTNLTVSSKEGARFPTPQTLLDKLYGDLSFDPLTFARADSKRQSETLRKYLRLDFTLLDEERARVFAQRTNVNRDGQALRSRFDAAPHYPTAPEAEQSAASILAERDQAQVKNDENAQQRQRAKDAARDVRTAADAVQSAERSVEDARAAAQHTTDEIVRLQALLSRQGADVREREAEVERRQGTVRTLQAKAEELATAVAALADQDLAPFGGRVKEVETVNAQVRANVARATLAKDLEAKRTESATLTARLEAIDGEKAGAIAAARMPVEGLGFDATGVTFNGLPFDQASSAEQLRVSVAMGLALNPRLKVLLVRDGSLLDHESLALVAKMAEDAGAQVWIERVEADDAVTVLIEDGQNVPAHADAGEAVRS